MTTANGKHFLADLEKKLKRLRPTLTKVTDTIRLEDISNYPIIVVSAKEMLMGVPVFDVAEMPDTGFIYASTLEEFHAKGIIAVDRLDDFKQLYRSHTNELCCFVPNDEGGAQFVFF